MDLIYIDLPTTDIEAIKAKLAARDVSFIAKRDVDAQQSVAYFSSRAVNNSLFLIELKFKAGMNISKVTVKSPNKVHSEMCKVAIGRILTSHN